MRTRTKTKVSRIARIYATEQFQLLGFTHKASVNDVGFGHFTAGLPPQTDTTEESYP